MERREAEAGHSLACMALHGLPAFACLRSRKTRLPGLSDSAAGFSKSEKLAVEAERPGAIKEGIGGEGR